MISRRDWRVILANMAVLTNAALDGQREVIALLLKQQEQDAKFIEQVAERLEKLEGVAPETPSAAPDPIDRLLGALQFWFDNEATDINLSALATDDSEDTMGDLIGAALTVWQLRRAKAA